jgi:hypothetical protein
MVGNEWLRVVDCRQITNMMWDRWDLGRVVGLCIAKFLMCTAVSRIAKQTLLETVDLWGCYGYRCDTCSEVEANKTYKFEYLSLGISGS